METIFCFIFLFVLNGCQASEDYWIGQTHADYVNPVRLHHDLSTNLNRHQKSGHIVQSDHRKRYNDKDRPCSVKDINCIRQVFEHNSKCKPAYGQAPEHYVIKRVVMDVPAANASFVINDAQVKGLNSGRIIKFYINKKTDTLVLEVVFNKFVIYSPKTDIYFHRRGKEPIEVTDFTIIELNGLSLTLTVPHASDLNPAIGHVYTYLTETPILIIGPGLDVVDKELPDLKSWVTNIGVTAREGLVSISPYLMSAFIQSKICDYRLH